MKEENKSVNYHIDKNILTFFGITIVLFLSLLYYKYSTYEPCVPVRFATDNKQIRAGELVKFVDYSLGAKEWKWQFGDSTQVETSKKPYHIFKKPGKYKVDLLINGNCKGSQIVFVDDPIELLDSTKIPVFDVPNKIMVGEKLFALDNSKHAVEWEWRFGETAEVNSNERKASYTYSEPGYKTISLVVNGDLKHVARKRIMVIEKPDADGPEDDTPIVQADPIDIVEEPTIGQVDPEVPVEPEKPETPQISKKGFADMLIAVADEEKIDKNFEPYICNNDLNMTIMVNGKPKKFVTFCQKIAGKSIKIKELKIVREPGTNCIQSVHIEMKKGILSRIGL